MADIGFNINHAARRAGRYWEIDGLPRISFGLLRVLMGSLCLWMSHIHASWRGILVLLLIGIAYAYLLGLPNSPGMRWLKEEITYPRTGYVALPRPVRLGAYPERFVYVFAAFPVLFESAWIGAILLAVATSILWYVTRGRFQHAGIILPGYYLSEILLVVLPIAKSYRIWYMFIAFSLVDAFAGVIQLVTYLRRHPVAQA